MRECHALLGRNRLSSILEVRSSTVASSDRSISSPRGEFLPPVAGSLQPPNLDVIVGFSWQLGGTAAVAHRCCQLAARPCRRPDNLPSDCLLRTQGTLYMLRKKVHGIHILLFFHGIQPAGSFGCSQRRQGAAAPPGAQC